MTSKIIWTYTDEAPALATYSLFPIVKAYVREADIDIEMSDISLTGRIIACFPEGLSEQQKTIDHLALLGEVCLTPEANILKLPNISATLPQLQAAIKELQEAGYDVPDYPEVTHSDAERDIQSRYAGVLGSAVNPVLREGNSDRRPPLSVKKFAKQQPHQMMQAWPNSGSQARVAHMDKGDFFESERSLTVTASTVAQIEFVSSDGSANVLKEGLLLQEAEVIDVAVMDVASLRSFYQEQIELAKRDGVLLSLHLKATMMKVSDPIIFGHCVSVYYRDALDKHAESLESIGVNPNNGVADLFDKIDLLPQQQKDEIERDINEVYEGRPALAMVDSRRGITNLHFPNDIIIDASMPNIVRDGGKMWNAADELQDCVAMIPDRSYATMYSEIIEDVKANGQFDPATMGNVSNVGLMAQKAEEYGSHDKTFVATEDGIFRVVDDSQNILLEQPVKQDDIFRMCQTKDAPVRDWVKLAVSRARATGAPAVFWLNDQRAHDVELIAKVNEYLQDHELSGVDIRIMSPVEAMAFALERIRRGEDTIAVTGNVLRDYLTDLFPILELGTSARMLSIVPLLNGGGLFETGAGGSAPKHVQQFVEEGHLRWDSLGEYSALVPSLESIADSTGNDDAGLLARTLDEAITSYLEHNRAPSRRTGEIDNRGSTFYLAQYWAQALATQKENGVLRERFMTIAKALEDNEAKILDELIDAQGVSVELGGYYMPDPAKAEQAMRPSKTLNSIIDGF